jgi:hypothetical protein
VNLDAKIGDAVEITGAVVEGAEHGRAERGESSQKRQ